MNPITILDPMTGLPVDATTYVSEASSAGTDIATIANYLVRGGLALGDFAGLVSAVQTNGALPSQQTAMLEYQLQLAKQQQQTKTLLLIGAVIAVAYFATRK